MKKVIKKAFTLTELLIALAVIGILVAILLPVIFNMMPDQNALMAKRAYYTIQTVVSDLINDEGCYPASPGKVGFDDGYGYINCLKWGADDNSKINTENAFKKFVTLVADKVDIKEDATINTDNASFITKDGMVWNILSSSNSDASKYSNAVKDFFAVITVDVNGGDKPSCGQSDVTAGCNPAISKGFDQFGVALGADGRLVILDGWARAAVKVNKDISGNEKDVDENHTIQPGETTTEGGTAATKDCSHGECVIGGSWDQCKSNSGSCWKIGDDYYYGETDEYWNKMCDSQGGDYCNHSGNYGSGNYGSGDYGSGSYGSGSYGSGDYSTGFGFNSGDNFPCPYENTANCYAVSSDEYCRRFGDGTSYCWNSDGSGHQGSSSGYGSGDYGSGSDYCFGQTFTYKGVTYCASNQNDEYNRAWNEYTNEMYCGDYFYYNGVKYCSKNRNDEYLRAWECYNGNCSSGYGSGNSWDYGSGSSSDYGSGY